MKIILCEDVVKLGAAGEVKDVSEGYARNFLFPLKLALTATDSNIKKWESEKKVREIRLNQSLEAAQKTAAQLEQISVELTANAGREGHLFGSITNQMVAGALLEKGFSIDKKQIILGSPIKSVGEYQVFIRLHAQVQAPLKLKVLSDSPTAHQAPASAPPEASTAAK